MQIRTIPINQLAADIQAGKVSEIVVNGDDLTVTYNGTGEIKQSTKESSSGLIDQLVKLGVTPEKLQDSGLKIEIKKPSAWTGILDILGYICPLFLCWGFWFSSFARCKELIMLLWLLVNPARDDDRRTPYCHFWRCGWCG